MGSALPRLWPALQSKPYGFSSDLVVTASDQRPDAVPSATVTMRVRSTAPHYLHYWVRFRHRNRIGADRWQSGRRGHTDRANEDRGKNENAFGHSLRADRPLAPWMLSTVCLRLGEELWCSRPVSALAIQPAKSAIGATRTRPAAHRNSAY
jgi:hypothetical protein